MGDPSFPKLPIYSAIFLFALTVSVRGKLFEFAEVEGNPPCILVDIHFSLVIRAQKGGEEVARAKRTQDNVTIVRGSCGDTNAVMNLVFVNGTNWGLIFKKSPSGDVQLDRLIQLNPREVFGDLLNDSAVLSFNDPGTTDLFNSSLSYQCDSKKDTVYKNTTSTPRSFAYGIQVQVTRFHAQAFNVENGQFSPAVKCEADNSTTTTTTLTTLSTSEGSTTPTLSPGTTAVTPTSPPVNNYTVQENNVTCIFLQGAFSVGLRYEANVTGKLQRDTINVNIPKEALTSGNCNASSSVQNMKISFFEGWWLQLDFDSTSESLLSAEADKSDDISYKISNITMKYIVDGRFNNSVIPMGTGVEVVPASTEPDFPKKSSDNGYYRCRSPVKLELTDDVTITAYDLRFRAFNKDNDATFTGGADECTSDRHTDSDIPIAVGCSLAALLITVVVVYTVSAYKKKRKMDRYVHI